MIESLGERGKTEMVQEFLEKQLCSEGGIELIIRELKPAETTVQVLGLLYIILQRRVSRLHL